MRRVTLDSNVYISALNFGGKPLQVLELARERQIENAISNAIITETSRILYTKLYWNPEDITDAIEQLLGFSTYVHADYTLDVVPSDPDDNRVIECALRARSDTHREWGHRPPGSRELPGNQDREPERLPLRIPSARAIGILLRTLGTDVSYVAIGDAKSGPRRVGWRFVGLPERRASVAAPV